MTWLSLRAWPYIAAGTLAVGLVVALLLTRATLSEAKGERDMAEAKLAISNASIAALEGKLTAVLAEQQMLEHNDAARMQASRQSLKMVEAAGKVRQVAIDRLLQSAAMAPPSVSCEASSELLENWPS